MEDIERISRNILDFLQISENDKYAYVCEICLELLKNPVNLVPCGHVFCEQCVVNLETCPSCRERIQQTTPALKLREAINGLPVKCVCGYVVRREDLAAHSATCPNVKVACPNKCGETFVKSQLESHKKQCLNRPIRCECGQEIPFTLLEPHKDEECEFEKPCQYCLAKVMVKRLKTHYNTCTKRLLQLLKELLPDVDDEVREALLQQCNSNIQKLLNDVADIYSVAQCVEFFNIKGDAEKYLIPQLFEFARINSAEKVRAIRWPNCIWIFMRSTESAAALIASLKEKGFPFVREPRAPNGDFYLGKVDHFEFCPPLSLVDCFFAKCGTVPNPDCPLRHVQHSTLNECKFWKLGVVCKYKKCYYLHPAMRVLQNNFRSVSPNPCKYCSENRMHYSWDCPKRSKHDKELEKIADTLEILLQNGPLSFFEAAGKLEALMSSPVSNRELGAVIHKYPQKFIRQGTIVRLNQYNSRQDAIYNNNNNNNNNSNMATSVLTMPRVTDISMKFSEKWKPREREWSEAEWREFTNDMKIVFYNFCSAPDITPQLRQELGNIVKLFEKNLLHDTRLCCQRFRFVAERKNLTLAILFVFLQLTVFCSLLLPILRLLFVDFRDLQHRHSRILSH